MLEQRRLHRPRLVRVHRHARLGQDVLAGIERGDRDRGVEVGPRRNDDSVDGRIVEQIDPVVVGPGDVELLRGALRGCRRAIHEADQLDALDLPESGHVSQGRDPAGPDEPDADSIRHLDVPRVRSRFDVRTVARRPFDRLAGIGRMFGAAVQRRCPTRRPGRRPAARFSGAARAGCCWAAARRPTRGRIVSRSSAGRGPG